MGQPVAVTDQNLAVQLAPYIGEGFFGTSKTSKMAEFEVAHPEVAVILKKASAFGGAVGTAADTERKLDVLKDTGLLKLIIDEANAQKAVLDPKAYLKKYNEDKMDILTRSSKAALVERDQLIESGASASLANKMAEAIFGMEKTKNDIILGYKYPNDTLKDVEHKLKEKATINLGKPDA